MRRTNDPGVACTAHACQHGWERECTAECRTHGYQAYLDRGGEARSVTRTENRMPPKAAPRHKK